MVPVLVVSAAQDFLLVSTAAVINARYVVGDGTGMGELYVLFGHTVTSSLQSVQLIVPG